MGCWGWAGTRGPRPQSTGAGRGGDARPSRQVALAARREHGSGGREGRGGERTAALSLTPESPAEPLPGAASTQLAVVPPPAGPPAG